MQTSTHSRRKKPSYQKGNISSHFVSSGDVLSSLSIFDQRKMPSVDSDDRSCYGEDSVSTLLAHYSTERSAEALQGEEAIKEAMISPDICMEWKMFRQFRAKQPEVTFKELVSNENYVPKLKYTCHHWSVHSCCYCLHGVKLLCDEADKNPSMKLLK